MASFKSYSIIPWSQSQQQQQYREPFPLDRFLQAHKRDIITGSETMLMMKSDQHWHILADCMSHPSDIDIMDGGLGVFEDDQDRFAPEGFA